MFPQFSQVYSGSLGVPVGRSACFPLFLFPRRFEPPSGCFLPSVFFVCVCLCVPLSLSVSTCTPSRFSRIGLRRCRPVSGPAQQVPRGFKPRGGWFSPSVPVRLSCSVVCAFHHYSPAPLGSQCSKVYPGSLGVAAGRSACFPSFLKCIPVHLVYR